MESSSTNPLPSMQLMNMHKIASPVVQPNFVCRPFDGTFERFNAPRFQDSVPLKEEMGSPDWDILRKQLRLSIELKLKEKHSNMEDGRLRNVSRYIETLLFNQNKGKRGDAFKYADHNTLSERLVPIMQTLMLRKEKKTKTYMKRIQTLHASLGSSYVATKQLVFQVKRTASSAGTDATGCQLVKTFERASIPELQAISGDQWALLADDAISFLKRVNGDINAN